MSAIDQRATDDSPCITILNCFLLLTSRMVVRIITALERLSRQRMRESIVRKSERSLALIGIRDGGEVSIHLRQMCRASTLSDAGDLITGVIKDRSDIDG